MFTAIVRISGAGRLADFREHLRQLMVRDPDAEDYTEHHGEGFLEYRFTPKRGIPFPAFTQTSGEFPELRVEAEWEHDSKRGRAVIEAGQLVEQGQAGVGDAGVDVAVGEAGRLELGMVCRSAGGECFGYAAAADRHTYFRYRGGALELVAAEAPAHFPDDALEDTAFGFVEEWIWYDEEEAALERVRYASYGYPVRGANLKSEKLAQLRHSGGRYSSLDALGREARERLIEKWLKRA
ncbi:MAG TPA: hypothetical protein VF110_02405 [Burkholderiales bacterium]